MNLSCPKTPTRLPRLLYLGDVPVESSYHGSALLYRLLQNYPPERLQIVEGNLRNSLPERRLHGVPYRDVKVGWRRPLYTRFNRWATLAYSRAARWRPAAVQHALGGFQPEAVLTVAHEFLWLTAAEFARQHHIPLHLICHDDWPSLAPVPRMFRPWLSHEFARAYRQAQSRLCVSPYMAEEYQRRYGVPGSVLYPSRSSDCPMFEAATPRALADENELVIGYGGNGCADVVSCLRDLASVFATAKGRLSVFGPFAESVQRQLLAISPAITFHGMVPYRRMITELRATADLLFVPMAFGEASRDNMIVSFPSKLADYTATGRPLLIYGPPYCSAVRWARLNPDVAEVVDQADPALLLGSLQRLRQNPDRRRILAERGVAVGAQCFNASSARERLYAVLMGATQRQHHTELQRLSA